MKTKTIELVLKNGEIIWIRMPVDSEILLNENSSMIKKMTEFRQTFTVGIDLTIK